MKLVLFNGHDLVLVITIYQCILFAVFLIASRKLVFYRRLLLALFLLSQAAISLDILVWWGQALRPYIEAECPWLLFLFRTAHWIEAPLLLLYVRAMMYGNAFFKKMDWFLFVPFFLSLAHYLFSWAVLDYEAKIAELARYSLESESIYSRVFFLVREGFRFFVIAYALYELLRYQKRIREAHSNLSKINLDWLKLLASGFLFLRAYAIVISLGLISKYEFSLPINTEYLGLGANYVLLVFLSFLIYFGLTRSIFFSGLARESATSKKPIAEIPVEDVNRILSYMQSEKPFLDHYLRVESLAEKLEMSPRLLSNCINRHLNKSFFEFVNGYRVEEAKYYLLSSEYSEATILEIMEHSGFNSKATFNTLFKKTYGLTPSQFRRDSKQKEELN